jgi:hypothetical protein
MRNQPRPKNRPATTASLLAKETDTSMNELRTLMIFWKTSQPNKGNILFQIISDFIVIVY